MRVMCKRVKYPRPWYFRKMLLPSVTIAGETSGLFDEKYLMVRGL